MVTFKHFTNYIIFILVIHILINYDFIHIALHNKGAIKKEKVKILLHEKLTCKRTIIEIHLNG